MRMTLAAAIIVDIVRSRTLADRAGAQQAVLESLERACDDIVPVQPPWATVGDEFQVLVSTIGEAMRVTALTRLMLPAELDCRFGIGYGTVTTIDDGQNGPINDGSAWWNARAAIEHTQQIEQRTAPFARSWCRSDPDAHGSTAFDDTVNAHLLVRDHLIDAMSDRSRRLTAGSLRGTPQSELGRAERISQSAVSQNLRSSGGAALVAAHRVLVSGDVA